MLIVMAKRFSFALLLVASMIGIAWAVQWKAQTVPGTEVSVELPSGEFMEQEDGPTGIDEQEGIAGVTTFGVPDIESGVFTIGLVFEGDGELEFNADGLRQVHEYLIESISEDSPGAEVEEDEFASAKMGESDCLKASFTIGDSEFTASVESIYVGTEDAVIALLFMVPETGEEGDALDTREKMIESIKLGEDGASEWKVVEETEEE